MAPLCSVVFRCLWRKLKNVQLFDACISQSNRKSLANQIAFMLTSKEREAQQKKRWRTKLRRAPYLMLACYYSQGKQLASGVIVFLTCQSHYNVSGNNTTPCARLLLHHPLDQRILTQPCEWCVSVSGVHDL